MCVSCAAKMCYLVDIFVRTLLYWIARESRPTYHIPRPSAYSSPTSHHARILSILTMPHDELYNTAQFVSCCEGMSTDVTTSRQDMAVQLHLDAVTLQDRARPDDSPFRNMIYSMPDETSHGGLIHVTYWASAGGVRRVPPASIAETSQQYDMVVDARFSTLKVGWKGKQRTVIMLVGFVIA